MKIMFLKELTNKICKDCVRFAFFRIAILFREISYFLSRRKKNSFRIRSFVKEFFCGDQKKIFSTIFKK